MLVMMSLYLLHNVFINVTLVEKLMTKILLITDNFLMINREINCQFLQL